MKTQDSRSAGRHFETGTSQAELLTSRLRRSMIYHKQTDGQTSRDCVREGLAGKDMMYMPVGLYTAIWSKMPPLQMSSNGNLIRHEFSKQLGIITLM